MAYQRSLLKLPKACDRASERGSAIAYVFIGIILFGALMFMFSRNANQNSSGFSKQENIVKAQAVIQYGDSVANAVNKLMTNGVSENDISFETEVFKDKGGSTLNLAVNYPNCINNKCKVFHKDGGRITAQVPVDLGPLDPNSPSYYQFPGGLLPHVINMKDVGTSLPELVLTFYSIPKNVCAEINTLLNNQFSPNPPIGDNPDASDQFAGSFPTSAATTLGDSDDAWAEGKTAYCYKLLNGIPDMYVYQKVAITR